MQIEGDGDAQQAGQQFEKGHGVEGNGPPAVEQKVDVICDQPDGGGGHGGSLDDQKKTFQLHIAKGVFFVGRLIEEGDQKDRGKEHDKLDAVVNGVQKHGLRAGVNGHDQLQQYEKQVSIQGDRHGRFFFLLSFSSDTHRLPPPAGAV